MAAVVQITYKKDTGKYVCVIDGNTFSTRKRDYIEYMYRKITGVKATFEEIVGEVVEPKAQQFSINERFHFVENLVAMVATGLTTSAVITGDGGLGKTYTVNKTLIAEGLKDLTQMNMLAVGTIVSKRNAFVTVKGYSTPKGLYRTLYENKDSVIVFDDCDSILKDPTATNLLKAALDSYSKRVLSWNSESFRGEDDLPRSFEFTGRVIFISNLGQDKIDQAIRSRSMMVDLSMTEEQKIDRMETIAQSEDFMPDFSQEFKQDALDLIRSIKDEAKEISLRTLITVTKIRASGNANWKGMASYILCS